MCVKKVFSAVTSLFAPKPKVPVVNVNTTSSTGQTEAELRAEQERLIKLQQDLATAQQQFAQQMQEWQAQRDKAAALPPPLPATAIGAVPIETAADADTESSTGVPERRGRRSLRIPRNRVAPRPAGGSGLNIPT